MYEFVLLWGKGSPVVGCSYNTIPMHLFQELAVVLVELPLARMLTLSTKPRPATLQVCRAHCSTRSTLKNKKRMGERGEPCGIPVDTSCCWLCQRPKTREVCRSVRKLAVHWTSAVGTALFRRLCSSRSCDTFGKAPDMSRLRSVATFGRAAVPWPLGTGVRVSSIDCFDCHYLLYR